MCNTPVVTAVAEVRPEGQKVTKCIIEFKGEVPNINEIEIKNRTIVNRNVESGVVTLKLDENEKAANTYQQEEHNLPFKPGSRPALHPGGPGGKPGGGPGGPPRNMKPRALYPIKLTAVIPGIGEVESTQIYEPIVEDFTQHDFGHIAYNLFVPKNREEGKKYPLVVFMPDASVNGPEIKAALVQGIGATVWASAEEQAKRPCYVAAVQVVKTPETLGVINSDIIPNELIALIDKLCKENDIDTNRIYSTGQSQGCIMSLRLNYEHPELFAASLLVSGQWDAEKAGTLTNARFFIGVSEGGMKEYPGMNMITENIEQNGGSVIRLKLNYRDGFKVNDEKIRAADDGKSIIYVVYDKDTIFPDDGLERAPMAHHARGWQLTYQLESAREWLFRQHK